MHGEHDRGGPDPALDPVVIRSLTREYRVHADCPKIVERLRFLEAAPDMPGEPLVPFRCEVRSKPPFYRLTTSGWDIEGSPGIVVERLYWHIYGELSHELPDGALLHAASMVAGEKRIVLVGSKGAGKTTLLLRLLAEGFDIEGDEHVALRDDDLLTRPRRLHVKQGSLALVPDFAEEIARAPRGLDQDGNVIHAVDPSIAGRPWRIVAGLASHFVFIEPNHGGRSVLAPLPFERAFAALPPNAALLGTDRLHFALMLRRHLTAVKTWRLSLGDHRGAVDHLRRLVN